MSREVLRELKQMLAHVVLNYDYDMKFENGGVRPPNKPETHDDFLTLPLS
jgi:hypothetical protein